MRVTIQGIEGDWGEITAGHWAVAGALVKALRAEGFPLRRVKS